MATDRRGRRRRQKRLKLNNKRRKWIARVLPAFTHAIGAAFLWMEACEQTSRKYMSIGEEEEAKP